MTNADVGEEAQTPEPDPEETKQSPPQVIPTAGPPPFYASEVAFNVTVQGVHLSFGTRRAAFSGQGEPIGLTKKERHTTSP